MHELALSEAIADTVAARAGSRPVTEARVRIGFLRQVVPEALTFAWSMITDGTRICGTFSSSQPMVLSSSSSEA